MTGEMLLLIAAGLAVLTGIIIGTVIYLYFFRLWFRTHIAQCSLPLWTIFGMFLRGGNPQMLVNSYIDLHKSGMKVTVEELEGLAKDGGNVRKVAQAMVAAKRNGHVVSFSIASALELDGKDVMQEIGVGADASPVAAE